GGGRGDRPEPGPGARHRRIHRTDQGVAERSGGCARGLPGDAGGTTRTGVRRGYARVRDRRTVPLPADRNGRIGPMTVALRVIPCLDVDAGRVVKGVNFAQLRDAGDPVELARRYDAERADEVTFLDVSASTEGRATTRDIVARTAEELFVPLTVG